MCAVNGPHYEKRNKYKTRKNGCCHLFPATTPASPSLCFTTWFFFFLLLHLQDLSCFLYVASLNTCRESPLFTSSQRSSCKAFNCCSFVVVVYFVHRCLIAVLLAAFDFYLITQHDDVFLIRDATNKTNAINGPYRPYSSDLLPVNHTSVRRS